MPRMNYGQKALKLLDEIVVADVDLDVDESYERSEFGYGWDDVDGDGQNTRAEVLIKYHRKGRGDVEFATDAERRVVAGRWRCRFTSEWFTDASELDIDHIVPLKNAWISGANLWTPERREQYSNGFGIRGRRQRSWLVPVDASANRSKGSRSLDLWMPENEKYHPRYVSLWIRTKHHWKLTMTPAEVDFCRKVLEPFRSVDS